MEAKGKQDLWTRQRPEVVEALRRQAIIQSVESSNRIEGVTVSQERLAPLVFGKTAPKDRSEEEIAGYRAALEWIFAQERPVPLTPDLIQHLHGLAQQGACADAGQWKTKDNEIIEILPDGRRHIRFVPTPAADTAEAMLSLCAHYSDLREAADAPPLLLVCTCVFDFLCIHPFRDGNGRVARLLTTFLLQQEGFIVGRFISLERLIENSRQDYYDVLKRCSAGWGVAENEIIPWWNYLLGIIRRAYGELATQVESAAGKGGKWDLVRQTALMQVRPFTLAELAAQCPGISLPLVKKVLAEMKDEGLLRLTGRGRSAMWSRTLYQA